MSFFHCSKSCLFNLPQGLSALFARPVVHPMDPWLHHRATSMLSQQFQIVLSSRHRKGSKGEEIEMFPKYIPHE
jgi:hypothetical protein